MSSKKSNVSFKSTEASVKSKPVEQDVYDLWRPPLGVRYELEQTNLELDAVVPHVKLKYTTVEYEPGQDLTEHVVEEEPVKFVKQRGRGPVFKFIEDIQDVKYKKMQQAIIDTLFENCRRKRKQKAIGITQTHKAIMHEIGPVWYHELSPKQMQSADYLKEAMKKDHAKDTLINTQETLTDMGIVLRPNHTKIEYALKRFYLCPVEFLLTLVRLNRPKEPEKQEEYTLNDRIMLSCVVHLSMRETLRELHLRTPSPPNVNKPKVKKPKKKSKRPYRHYDKWKKGMSPYLEPQILVEQHHINEVYKNRHKEYASLDYFDYVNDMWNVFWVDDPESVQKRKAATELKPTKWNRPPKIPVRFIESKMKKKKIFICKKPSPYTTPCKKIRFSRRKIEEAEPEEIPETIVENMCRCSPLTFDEDTAFMLKIKITTSQEEMLMTQKLYPYNETHNIGDLNLEGKTKLKPEEGKYGDASDGKLYQKIEYSCECCTCGKGINIFPDENGTPGLKNIDSIKQQIEDQFDCSPECLNTITEEAQEQLDECEAESESDTRICKCRSLSTIASDINDPYYLCTCKKSSDDCTCCICGQIDKNFVLRIKRYNKIHGTHYEPCLCECKCKKKKKPPCCNAELMPCKYCFCKKKKPVVEEEEVEEEQEKPPAPVVVVVEPEVKKIESEINEKRKTVVSDIIEIEDVDRCNCDKLYTRFLDQHESCISLFGHYEKKIQEDVEEYVKDMKNRCLCGDSDSADDEDEAEEEHPEEEQSDSGSCICLKQNAGKCCCCKDSSADLYAGCTCNEGVAGCTCNDTDTTTTSTSTESSDQDKCYCACNCTDGPCQCAVMLQQVMEAKAAKAAELEEQATQDALQLPEGTLKKSGGTSQRSGGTTQKSGGTSQKSTGTSKKALKTPAEMTEAQIEKEMLEQHGEGEDGHDPRIFILSEFPKNPIDQMDLLKTLLAALAEDGYPLAKLPDVHRLPHFQIWLNKRSGKYISMEDREYLYEVSKFYWQHIEFCDRQVANPELPIPFSQVHKCTWGGVKKYNYLIDKVKTDYRRKLKQAYIDKAQEVFPSCFVYLLPTKTFREVYFSYLPADENHCFVFKPWEVHQHKDMSKRKSCL